MLPPTPRFFQHSGIWLGAPALLWQLLFLWLPLLCLIYLSFTATGSFGEPLQLTAYRAVLNWVHLKVILRSLVLATSVSLLCLAVAYPVAYYLALYTTRWVQRWALFLLTLPFWINFLVHVYAWFFILERDGLLQQLLNYCGLATTNLSFSNNLFATVLVMFQVYLPFMLLPLFTTLEKFNHTLIESALDLGATHWQTFWQITVPLSFSGVRTGFLLVFVLCFGEYAIPILLGGSKTFYVGSLITEYCLIAHDLPKGAAFMVLSALALMLLLWLLSLAQRAVITRGQT